MPCPMNTLVGYEIRAGLGEGVTRLHGDSLIPVTMEQEYGHVELAGTLGLAEHLPAYPSSEGRNGLDYRHCKAWQAAFAGSESKYSVPAESWCVEDKTPHLSGSDRFTQVGTGYCPTHAVADQK